MINKIIDKILCMLGFHHFLYRINGHKVTYMCIRNGCSKEIDIDYYNEIR